MGDVNAVNGAGTLTISQATGDQLRPSDDAGLGAIIRVGPGRRSEAIERLVGTIAGDRVAVDRFLHYAKANAIRLDGLWSRLDQAGSIAFSVLVVPSAGRTAMVFSSRPASPRRIPAITGLIDHACGQLGGWNVNLAQALIEPAERAEREAFTSAGFLELSLLSYLERPLSRTDAVPAPQWPPGVRIEPYAETLHDDLVRALEESYERTLDCPGLYGLRTTDDIIAGHMATGQFVQSLWTLLRMADKPAGALLLNPFPGHRTAELVYLGLAPAARGRGLGRQLLRYGLGLLKKRRERTLTLAVDEHNTPALALYRSEGFRPLAQRVALIRPLGRPPDRPAR